MFPPKLDTLPSAQRAHWPLLAELPRHFVLYGGTAVALRLGHLEAIHPLGTNAIITLKALVYFKGGDLDKLPEDLKRYLEEAVRPVRDVVPFRGSKLPIGTI